MNEIIEQATNWYIHGPRWQVFILALPVACLCVNVARKLLAWWKKPYSERIEGDLALARYKLNLKRGVTRAGVPEPYDDEPPAKPIAPGTPYGSAPDEAGRPVTRKELDDIVGQIGYCQDKANARIAALEAAQKPTPADEYEPVGTLPIVGDRVRWKWRDEPFDGIATEVIGDDGCAITKGTVQVRCARTMEHWRFALDQVAGSIMFRILKRAPAQPGVLIDGAWWRGFKHHSDMYCPLFRDGTHVATAKDAYLGCNAVVYHDNGFTIEYMASQSPVFTELPTDQVRQLHAEAKKAGVV